MQHAYSHQHNETEIDTLFADYLNICNKAIATHKDEFPYKHLLRLSKSVAGDRTIDLAVYNDEAIGTYSLALNGNTLCQEGSPEDSKKAWRVNLSYLHHVIENPKDYIDHPEKLDLDWLKSRMGML